MGGNRESEFSMGMVSWLRLRILESVIRRAGEWK